MVKSNNLQVSEQILKKFAELIQIFGIKQITIDIIAEKCGISKKTVYKYFDSKTDMVVRIMDDILDQLAGIFDEIKHSGKKPLDKLNDLFDSLYRVLGSISTPVLHDIKTGYPEINLRIEDIIRSTRELIKETIVEGINSGDFYRDIDPVIATDMAMASAERILNPDYILSNNLSIEQAITGFKTLIIHAVVNSAGAES